MEFQEKKKKRKIVLFLIIFIFLFLILFFNYVYFKEKIYQEREKILLEFKLEKQLKLKKEKLFLYSLKSNSVLIQELETGKNILEKNIFQILPIASLAKIMNGIIFLKEKQRKNIVITKKSLLSEGDYGLMEAEIFSKKNALNYMLIGSVNDIASAIALGDKNFNLNFKHFIQKMNNFAKKINMNSTLFFNENGLDVNYLARGSYSTAENISKMIKYFYKNYPVLAKQTIKKKMKICSQKKCHLVKNTNLILKKYPEIIFSKTGYTHKTGGVISVIVEIRNKKYIIIILDSTKKGRFEDLESVIFYLKKNI